jgi:peptide/nickel transport system substrate-binding protein
MRSTRVMLFAAVGLVTALLLAACGSSSESGSSGSSATDNGASVVTPAGYNSSVDESLTGKRGGTLEVLQEADFEHLDPGVSYFALDYTVVFATQRPLYSNLPNSNEPSPDMAASKPEVSADNKTITVHLKEGIHFSPPVNREVVAQDVAYAIERGANENVANPYIQTYFSSIEGMPQAKGGPIKGIETPNKHEIVFHLTEPKGFFVAEALCLPLTAAVPKEYAEKYDKSKPSAYANYQVATGPYMLKNNAEGKVLGIGYVPGKSATLVRNPNWSAKTDFRPAYLNEIKIHLGGTQSVIDRQVLEGKSVVQNEPVVQSAVKLAAENYKSQLDLSPGAGNRYITLNNKVPPFNNINLRKAVYAAVDRAALDRERGGTLVTNVATHFIYPTIPGFEQAGGLAGPKLDYNEHPEGSMTVAQKYMKLAGYPSGKYTGTKTVQVVGASSAPEKEDAEIVNQTLKSLGFNTKLTLVEIGTMYAKYCDVPKEEIEVCPTVGWIADFADPQTVLKPTFEGSSIVPTGNVNQGQVNVPKINEAMAAAELIKGKEERSKAWGKIDDELVENAVAIPYDWEKSPRLAASNVHGVAMLWNEGSWDYSFTSLK